MNATTFPRIDRLPPYVFKIVNTMKMESRARGEDIIDFGMGNPDQPTPLHIVEKACQILKRTDTHRYSQSAGIPRLRTAICDWYKRKFDVALDPQTEAIVTIGSKEGIAHLALGIVEPGDAVVVPNPTYPIHPYSFVIAGANVLHVPLCNHDDFFEYLLSVIRHAWPQPKFLVLSFPANPTAQCVDITFFEKIIAAAEEYGIWVIHDFAYADIAFDGYTPPSILQVPGAKECAVEFYSLSKSYNMPGWRVGFCCGNQRLIGALSKIKSYLDYGIFTPIQVAAISALEGPQDCVRDICQLYQRRRDVLCEGLNAIGWKVEIPRATMFVWAKIPEAFSRAGSLGFAKFLLKEAKVTVSPGIGFGEYGDSFVRFALVENEQRIRQATRNIRQAICGGANEVLPTSRSSFVPQ